MNVVYSLLTYYIQFPHGLQVEAINIGVFSSTGYRFAIIVRCWYKTQFRTCRIIRCVILQQQQQQHTKKNAAAIPNDKYITP